MKITNVLLCLFLLGLSGLSYAGQEKDASSSKKDSLSTSDKKNALIAQAARDLKISNECYLEQEALFDLSARLEGEDEDDPNHKFDLIEDLLSKAMDRFDDARYAYLKSSRLLYQQDPAAFQKIGEKDYEDTDVIMQLLYKGSKDPFWIKMYEIRWNNLERRVHDFDQKIKIEKIKDKLIKQYDVLPADEAISYKSIQHSYLLRDALKGKKASYLETQALKELITRMKATKTTDGLLPRLEKDLKLSQDKFKYYAKYYDKIGAILKKIDLAAFQKIDKDNLYGTSGNDVWAILATLKDGAQAAEGRAEDRVMSREEARAFLKVFREISPDPETIIEIEKIVDEMATKYKIPEQAVIPGKIKKFTRSLKNTLKYMAQNSREIKALEAIIEQVKVAGGMDDKLLLLDKDLEKNQSKFDRHSKYADQLQTLLKESRNGINFDKFPPDQAEELRATLKLFDKHDDLIERENAEVAEFVKKVAKKHGLEGVINLAALKSSSKDCAANVLPKKTKGKKK